MKLMEKLVNTIAPSGHEKRVRDIIRKEIKPYVDEMRVDKFGNLICRRKGEGPRVMLAAHMDEIGLMIKYVEDNGRMHFLPVGGIEPLTLIGQRVALVANGKTVCHGIITFQELEEDNIVEDLPTMGKLYVDAGLDKKELSRKGIVVGTYAVPYQPFHTLGKEDYIAGKALDDRLGCYALIQVAKQLKKRQQGDIYYVFTCQEEVGMYGAQTAVYQIDPDWAIACDVTNAYDAGDSVTCVLGEGPTLTVMDSEMIANPCLNGWLERVAKKRKINVQRRVEEVGTTDATRIMLSKGGVPSTTVGVAVRNLHSTVGVAHQRDIDGMIKLLAALLRDPPKKCVV